MARHETGQLWAHAGGELSADEAARLEAHLRDCPACGLKLAEARAARALVRPPPVSPLPEAAWSRIDREVAAAARRELSRPRWWSLVFGPPGAATAALAFAALLLFVLWPKPVPPPPAPLAQVEPERAPAPLIMPPPPPAAPEPTRVASARGAESSRQGQRAPLAANASLEAGTTVSTEKKGELWLSLPDGSRAGVRGASRLVLARIERGAVRLELEQGALVVEATHQEGRTFEVHAGEVDIRVAGTRFLVERIEGRVLVAVSEGAVQVAAGEKLYTVAAGRKLTIEKSRPLESKLGSKDEDELSLLTPLPPRREQRPAPPEERPDEAWAAFDAGLAAPVAVAAVAELEAAPDTEFASYPGPKTVPPPPPPPPPVAVEAPPDAGEPNVLQRLLAADIDSPFPPVGTSMEEHRVRQILRLADNNQCEKVLARTDAWLEAYPDDGSPKRASLARQLLFTKARCLSKLGRLDEAAAIRAQLH